MDPQQMVDGVNRLIDDINAGKQVIYDIYSEQEKEKDPETRNTGLLFFRGNPGAPFGIICPGGGFYYVGSLHTGFPVVMELNKHGYNAFVLNYRVGDYMPGEYKSNEDLIRAAHFILEQVLDNCGTFTDFVPLTEEENDIIRRVVEIINAETAVPCTACEYCTHGCPKNIAIPQYFAIYNSIMRTTGSFSSQQVYYNNISMNGHGKAGGLHKVRKM